MIDQETAMSWAVKMAFHNWRDWIPVEDPGFETLIADEDEGDSDGSS